MSSGQMQDLVSSHISEGVVAKCIDIRAGGVGEYRSKMQVIVLRRSGQMDREGWWL